MVPGEWHYTDPGVLLTLVPVNGVLDRSSVHISRADVLSCLEQLPYHRTVARIDQNFLFWLDICLDNGREIYFSSLCSREKFGGKDGMSFNLHCLSHLAIVIQKGCLPSKRLMQLKDVGWAPGSWSEGGSGKVLNLNRTLESACWSPVPALLVSGCRDLGKALPFPEP